MRDERNIYSLFVHVINMNNVQHIIIMSIWSSRHGYLEINCHLSVNGNCYDKNFATNVQIFINFLIPLSLEIYFIDIRELLQKWANSFIMESDHLGFAHGSPICQLASMLDRWSYRLANCETGDGSWKKFMNIFQVPVKSNKFTTLWNYW